MYMFETTDTYFSLNWFLISTQSALTFEMCLVYVNNMSFHNFDSADMGIRVVILQNTINFTYIS